MAARTIPISIHFATQYKRILNTKTTLSRPSSPSRGSSSKTIENYARETSVGNSRGRENLHRTEQTLATNKKKLTSHTRTHAHRHQRMWDGRQNNRTILTGNQRFPVEHDDQIESRSHWIIKSFPLLIFPRQIFILSGKFLSSSLLRHLSRLTQNHPPSLVLVTSIDYLPR